MTITAVKRGLDKMGSWQEIKGFDKSDFREVVSIYRKSTLDRDEAGGLGLSAQDGLFPFF